MQIALEAVDDTRLLLRGPPILLEADSLAPAGDC